MLTIKIPVRASIKLAIGIIEASSFAEGLTVALRGTLKKCPGSTHWHWKRPGAKGTLEVTLWPQGQVVLLSVQASRDAPWIREILPRLEAALRAELRGTGCPE